MLLSTVLANEIVIQGAVDKMKPILEPLYAAILEGDIGETPPMMKFTIDAMRDAGVLDSVNVMVGGTPVTAEYAKQICADGYAPDAGQAASLVLSFIG